MKNYHTYAVITIFLVAVSLACNKDLVNHFEGFQKPSYFPEDVYHFETNEITEAGFVLGRKLFYDPALSANNTISCASCHIPTAAFTHPGHSVSHGIFDRLGTRNSPAIMNLAWNPSFMWDGGIFDLDLQPIAPITNHVEMADTVANVLRRLQQHQQYPQLFQAAFGSTEISSVNFLKALSQFMLMCVSNHSKYDSVMLGNATFSAGENDGYILFKTKCGVCHTEPLFTDHSFRNNGLAISAANDLGRYAITLHEEDKYKFKVPSLRNLSYTAPYMHDGRLLSLDAVLNHYSTKIQPTPNLDPLLQQGSQLGITLSADDKVSLKAFLKTLDDKIFVTDKRLAEQ